MTKLPGCCSCCDRPLFQAVSQHPVDHPKAGQITRSAELIDENAVRIAFVLTNGRRIEMSFCAQCGDDHDLKAVWKKNCAAWSGEVSDTNRDTIAQLVQEMPMGELYRERWKDLVDARLR